MRRPPIERRALDRPAEGERRPCGICDASMRFHERYTVTHGVQSLVLPAWVCSCGGEVFVRGTATDRSSRAAPPKSDRGRDELRRWLAILQTEAHALTASRESPREGVRHLMRMHGETLVSMAAIDDEGRYVAANPATCALLGYPEGDLLHLGIWDVSAPPLVRHHHAVWQEFLARGTAEGRYRLRRRTGELIVVNYASASHMLPGMHVSVMATRALLQHLATTQRP